MRLPINNTRNLWDLSSDSEQFIKKNFSKDKWYYLMKTKADYNINEK